MTAFSLKRNRIYVRVQFYTPVLSDYVGFAISRETVCLKGSFLRGFLLISGLFSVQGNEALKLASVEDSTLPLFDAG